MAMWRYAKAAIEVTTCPACCKGPGKKCVNADKEDMRAVHISRRRELQEWRKDHAEEYAALMRKHAKRVNGLRSDR